MRWVKMCLNINLTFFYLLLELEKLLGSTTVAHALIYSESGDCFGHGTSRARNYQVSL
jgi:hypothetical protein